MTARDEEVLRPGLGAQACGRGIGAAWHESVAADKAAARRHAAAGAPQARQTVARPWPVTKALALARTLALALALALTLALTDALTLAQTLTEPLALTQSLALTRPLALAHGALLVVLKMLKEVSRKQTQPGSPARRMPSSTRPRCGSRMGYQAPKTSTRKPGSMSMNSAAKARASSSSSLSASAAISIRQDAR